MKDILVLGIETSCDETSASVVASGRKVLSNIISSQIDLHKKFGGVVPEIASRRHVELILPVVDEALSQANISLSDVDIIGATYGPGLVGALLVGLTAAKSLSFALSKPFVGVNHIGGHIAANYLEHPGLEPPFICLVVSGGHSHIIHVTDYDRYEILGATRDDAAGEVFDKVARAAGLGYPGGPLIDKAAKSGNSSAIDFPRVRFSDGSLDFSFSGLKTAALNYLNSVSQKGEIFSLADFAASFQLAVVDILVENTIKGALRKNADKIVLAGGVAANSALRQKLQDEGCKKGFSVFYPSPVLCTDNGAMIACSAFYEYQKGHVCGLDLNADPGLKLGIACG